MSVPNYLSGNINALVPNISAQINNSPYLAQLLTAFQSNAGKFVVNDSDSYNGSYYNGYENEINIDQSVIPKPGASAAEVDTFVTMLAHELSHANRGDVYSNLASSAAEATQIGLQDEGEALTAEYIVAEQLNCTMYSGSKIQLAMDNIARGMPDGILNPNFASAAESAGAAYYAGLSPSNALAFNYAEYYAANWYAASDESSYASIDWSQSTPTTITTENGQTFDAYTIAFKDGSTKTINAFSFGMDPPLATNTEFVDAIPDIEPPMRSVSQQLTAEQTEILASEATALADDTVTVQAAANTLKGSFTSAELLGIAGTTASVLGTAALVGSYVYTANQALQQAEAGNTSAAQDTMINWTVETEGGLALGGAAAELALPLLAGGPIGWAAYAGVVLVAGYVGGQEASGLLNLISPPTGSMQPIGNPVQSTDANGVVWSTQIYNNGASKATVVSVPPGVSVPYTTISITPNSDGTWQNYSVNSTTNAFELSQYNIQNSNTVVLNLQAGEINAAGAMQINSYNGSGILQATTTSGAVAGGNQLTQVNYNGDGSVNNTQITTTLGSIQAVELLNTNGSGTISVNNGAGIPFSAGQTPSVVANGQIILSSVDSNSNNIQITYSDANSGTISVNNGTAIPFSTGQTPSVAANGQIVLSSVDSNGNDIHITYSGVNSGTISVNNGAAIPFVAGQTPSVNAAGDVVFSAVDVNGNTIQTTYADTGNSGTITVNDNTPIPFSAGQTPAVNANGQVVLSSVDANNNAIQLTYSSTGNSGTISVNNGVPVAFSADQTPSDNAAGQVVLSSVDANNNVLQIIYASDGNSGAVSVNGGDAIAFTAGQIPGIDSSGDIVISASDTDPNNPGGVVQTIYLAGGTNTVTTDADGNILAEAIVTQNSDGSSEDETIATDGSTNTVVNAPGGASSTTTVNNIDGSGSVATQGPYMVSGNNLGTITTQKIINTDGSCTITTDSPDLGENNSVIVGGVEQVVQNIAANGTSTSTQTFIDNGVQNPDVTVTAVNLAGTITVTQYFNGIAAGPNSVTNEYANDGSVNFTSYYPGGAVSSVESFSATGLLTYTYYNQSGSVSNSGSVQESPLLPRTTQVTNPDGSITKTTDTVYLDLSAGVDVLVPSSIVNTASNGSVTRETYSAAGLLAQVVTTPVDASQTTTEYFPDGNPSQSTSTSTNGTITNSTYYADGELASSSERLPDGEVDAADYFGNGEQEESSVINQSGASGQNIADFYNLMGQKTSDTWAKSGGQHGSDTFNANGSSSGSTYNSDGSYSTYTNDGKGDIVTTNYNANGDITNPVVISSSGSLAANILNATLAGISNLSVTGNSLNDVITGNAGNDTLQAGSGNDTLVSGAGNDTLTGASGGTTYLINVDAGQTAITSNSSRDTLAFGAGISAADILGYSTVANGSSAITLQITGGNSVTIDNPVFSQVSFAGGGSTTLAALLTSIYSDSSTVMPLNVTNLTLTGSANVSGTANNLNDVITANSGSDTLISGAGIDVLVGGSGNDTFVVNNTSDVVIASAIAGNNTEQTSVSTTLAVNVQNLVGSTGATNLVLTGNTLANTITANSGADTLVAGSGLATLIGGSGNDTFVINNASDVITEAVNAGNNTEQTMISATLAANVQNLTGTGTAALTLTGNTLNNIITGNSGNDHLVAGSGNDTLVSGSAPTFLVGGSGKDTFVVNNSGDVVTQATANVNDILQTSVNYVLSANLSKLTGIGSNAIALVGNTLADTITANSGNDTLAAGSGIDTLVAGAGNDIFVVNNSADAITASSAKAGNVVQSTVNYVLPSNLLNLTGIGTAAISLTGNTFANTITANCGADTLLAGSGLATLIGGSGNDTFVINNTADVIMEAVNTGNNTEQTTISATLASNVQNLTGTGTASLRLTGNTLTSNTITGNSGNDTLVAGSGNDTLISGSNATYMVAGTGNDTFVVHNSNDGVTATSINAADIVQTSANYVLPADLERLTSISASGTGIALIGNSLADTLTAGAGNDSLDSGSGIDVLIGGSGVDTFIINNSGDTVTASAPPTTDLEQSSVNYVLTSNLLDLSGIGSNAISLTGNSLANVIRANTGNDTLIAGSGLATLIGGAGNDTFVINNTSDVITEAANTNSNTEQASVSVTLANNVQNLSGTGTGALTLTGNTLNNVITGNSGADHLVAGSGNDTLVSGSGLDFLVSGSGKDTFVVNNSGDVVTVATANSNDVLQTSVNYALSTNLSKLTGIGSANISLIGNTLNDTITANSGNDTLAAGSGSATLVGGSGNDTFVLDNTVDVVNAVAGSNINTIDTSVSYTVAANVQDLILTGSTALTATGNSGNDLLIGNTGTDTLTGGAGTNVLEAGSKASALSDTAGSAAFIAGAGSDTVTGGSGSDFIAGSTGTETIALGAGNAVVAFNSGDGAASIAAGSNQSNVLSLGGGIAYSNLSFSKSGNNLILNTGGSNAITFTNWYGGSANQDFVTLQMVEQAASTYNASSSNVLYSSEVEEFSFTQLVAAFNTALAATPTLSSWSLSNSLLSAHLSSSNTAALGGDLGYYEGESGSLTGMNMATATSTLQSTSFGKTAQAIDAWSGISGGNNKLH